MSHVLFALFEHPAKAAEALKELHALGASKEGFSVVVHRRGLEQGHSEETPMFETDAAPAAAKGAVIGGVLGAIVGALVGGPFGLVGAGPLATALFASTAGTITGAFSGVMAGSTSPDPTLEALAQGAEAGKVVVSVDAPTLSSEEDAETILKRHGALVVHRRLLRKSS